MIERGRERDCYLFLIENGKRERERHDRNCNSVRVKEIILLHSSNRKCNILRSCYKCNLIPQTRGTHVHPHVKGCLCDSSQTRGTHVHSHVKGCVCDSSQTRSTHVDHHVKGCIFDYHKHEALTYTPCLGLCM